MSCLRSLSIGMLFLALGCSAGQGCRQEAQAPAVVLENARGESVRVRVEVAARPAERERGLMHRRRLDDDAGMIFIYPFEAVHSFWMKDTHIPLDLFFIGSNLRVVGVVENTRPFSLERIAVETPSGYVLEVNAGFARRHAIREGARVRLEGIAAGQGQ